MTNPIVKYWSSGLKDHEIWYQNRKKHREDGPAVIEYYTCGKKIQSEHWYLEGKRHRNDGPALTIYSDSGEICVKEWWMSGKRHRTDGPAYIDFRTNGRIEYTIWCLNGKQIRPDEWLKENNYKWPLNKNQQTELLLTFG